MLHEAILIATGVTLVLAVYNVIYWPKVSPTKEILQQAVSVLIPARNEEDNLPFCLATVLAQQEIVLEILIYDDHSSDRTAQIIAEYVKHNPCIKSISTSPLPTGWCGKNYACAQLAKKAQGEWLLFLDADTRLNPNAINRMVAEARSLQATFLSSWPKFEMHTWAERILMPMLNFVVFSLYPAPLALRRESHFQFNPRLGLAHGACLLFERESYEAFGGHEKVKDQIFEDTRIAQYWRASGRKGVCLDGQEIVRLRMYSSFSEIWLGFQKNFYPAFQRKVVFWLFILFHFLVFLAPFILVITLQTPLIILSVLFIILARLVLAVRFHHSLLSILFHPISELILICLGLFSWWKYKTGKGVTWKGREYPRSV